ncbi:hypothetical protein ABIA58_005613 [Pseudomonas frederiksbergensis]
MPRSHVAAKYILFLYLWDSLAPEPLHSGSLG